jgi:single-strand DNA-binding protein
MKVFGAARLGSDMEVRFAKDGEPVGNVSLAFRLGKKDKKTGEYMTQWVRASLFGKRAESLAPYLVKGSIHAFVLRDLHVEEFTTSDGERRVSVQATIDDVELCSKKDSVSAEDHARRKEQSHEARAGEVVGGGFDETDGDIPF